jgi:hypothetical protein
LSPAERHVALVEQKARRAENPEFERWMWMMRTDHDDAFAIRAD